MGRGVQETGHRSVPGEREILPLSRRGALRPQAGRVRAASRPGPPPPQTCADERDRSALWPDPHPGRSFAQRIRAAPQPPRQLCPYLLASAPIMRTTRRQLLRGGAALGAALALPRTSLGGVRRWPKGDQLRVGVVGVANRGAANLNGVSHEAVVALCDVDTRYLSGAASRFPEARTYTDWRRMLDEGGLDAIVVSTPDHTHAPPSAAALQSGLHVYCEKPLTHSVWEARRVTDLARENGLVTQMGTQIHAGDNYRRVVELIRSGAIGPVTEVHVWCNKSWSADVLPSGQGPVPEHLDWDLWTGPARLFPYRNGFHPGEWRRFWNYGGGTLGDMACHYMDLPFWALGLSHPLWAEAEGPNALEECAPRSLTARWGFPARGEDPALVFTWHDGDHRPTEALERTGAPGWGSGVLFIGERGALLADYGRHVLLPESEFDDFEAPERTIPSSIGHHREWTEACKSGGETTCNFDYAGPLTETVLLGAAAHRAGARLEWNAQELSASGAENAEELIRRPYRQGWSL